MSQRNTTTASRAVPDQQALLGGLTAFAAFTLWGLVPIYFKALGHVAAWEVLAHRVIWSALLLAGVLLLRHRSLGLGEQFGGWRQGGFYGVTALLLSLNWLVFIWAIQNDRVLEASLGYYINPLVNVLLGVLFLHERLRPVQLAAVALATLGVVNQVVGYGAVPWVSLVLAFSFGLYGLLRKKAGADALGGLFAETLLMSPVAMLYLIWLGANSAGAFLRVGLHTDILLVAAGIATSVPLLLFLEGARRITLSTLGLMQYIAPSLQFLLAVALYGETFTRTHLVTFVLIWSALGLYTLDTYRGRGRGTAVEPAPRNADS